MRQRWVSTVMIVVPSILATDAATCAPQNRVDYLGGTVESVKEGQAGVLDLTDAHFLAFYKKSGQIRVPYDHIELLEYGQKVDRRLLLALAISPILLLSKEHKHYLTLGFRDDNGDHQAMLFRVDKNSIRAALISLEARTGLKVQFQDEEARKAGKG